MEFTISAIIIASVLFVYVLFLRQDKEDLNCDLIILESKLEIAEEVIDEYIEKEEQEERIKRTIYNYIKTLKPLKKGYRVYDEEVKGNKVTFKYTATHWCNSGERYNTKTLTIK